MSSRRTLILIGSIVVSIVAVLLVWNYVNGIQANVEADAKEVTVFVAKAEISRGEDGDAVVQAGSVGQETVPQKYRPSTAIQSLSEIQRKVALFDIAQNTIIVDGMFVDPATATISFRERLKNPNHTAISISVDQVSGVGGFLVPGDQVNMLVLQNNDGARALVENDPAISTIDQLKEVGPQPLLLGFTARYLFQKVEIIAVGQNQLLAPGEEAAAADPEASGGDRSAGIITFNVPPEAAQYIASGNAQDRGFYLALVGKDYNPRALPPIPVVVDTLPGEDPAILTPYAYDEGQG